MAIKHGSKVDKSYSSASMTDLILSAEGVVGGIGDVESGPLDGVSGDTVDLLDHQLGLRVVLKADRPQLIGYQGDELMLLAEQIVVRNRLLPNLHHAGVHILQKNLALCIGGLSGNGATICHLHGEGHPGHRLSADGISLDDLQVRLGFIVDHQLGLLPGK